MEIQVKSVDSKHYQIIANNKILSQLIYPKWYSFEAIAQYNDKEYPIKPIGFWDSKIILSDEINTLISYRMTWKGDFELKDLISEKSYLISSKGILNRVFYLYDENKNVLLSLKEDHKWNKFSNDYKMDLSEEFLQINNYNLLLLAVVYGLNYYLASESGVIIAAIT